MLSPGAGSQGGWIMSRRNKQRCTAIHVTIPNRLLEDFDATIGYEHSRSKKIAHLMAQYLDEDVAYVATMTTRQLIAALTSREDCDATLRVLLLQVLSQ